MYLLNHEEKWRSRDWSRYLTWIIGDYQLIWSLIIKASWYLQSKLTWLSGISDKGILRPKMLDDDSHQIELDRNYYRNPCIRRGGRIYCSGSEFSCKHWCARTRSCKSLCSLNITLCSFLDWGGATGVRRFTNAWMFQALVPERSSIFALFIIIRLVSTSPTRICLSKFLFSVLEFYRGV